MKPLKTYRWRSRHCAWSNGDGQNLQFCLSPRRLFPLLKNDPRKEKNFARCWLNAFEKDLRRSNSANETF